MTGVRFFAAAYVVAYHFGQTALRWAPGPMRAFLSNGYAGVSFFFVLSGFILTYTYGLEPVDWRRFFASRVARIYPLYTFAWLLCVPDSLVHRFATDAVAVAAGKFAISSAAALSLTQAWIPNGAGALNPPGWSLSGEAFFYALFPLLLPLVCRLSQTRLVGFIAACWVASLLTPLGYIVAHWSHPERVTPYFTANSLAFVRYCPAFQLPQFLIGSAFGCLILKRDKDGARLPLGGMTSMALSIATLVFLSIPFGRFYLLVHDGLLAPLFGALVYSLSVEKGVITRALSKRSTVYLGRISYGIYILQVPVWMFFRMALSRTPLSSPLVTFALGVVLLIAASAAAFTLVEEPGRAFVLRRLTTARRDARELLAAPPGKTG